MAEIINSDSSQTSSGNEEEINFRKDFAAKLDSKNFLDKIRALNQLKSLLSGHYRNKVNTKLDKKLIKGFYRRVHNDA